MRVQSRLDIKSIMLNWDQVVGLINGHEDATNKRLEEWGLRVFGAPEIIELDRTKIILAYRCERLNPSPRKRIRFLPEDME